MPSELPTIALIAVGAVMAIGAAMAVFRRTEVLPAGKGHRSPQAHRPGLLSRVVDVLDASIAMYAIRALLGRSTVTRADGRAERARLALAAAEAAPGRGAVPGRMTAPPTRLVVAGTAASHAQRDLPDRQAHPVAARTVVPVWTSRSRVLPGAMAAAGLVVVAVAAFAMWPRNEGGVLSATGTPDLPSPTADLVSAPPATESPTVAPSPSPSPTATPTATPTAGPTATPTAGPTATPTAAPTPTPTPRPTARPTATPRPTSRPSATPTPTVMPTASPAPSATPSPTPQASPTPTVAPTATATPAPTATPPPEPTAAPTPTPTLAP